MRFLLKWYNLSLTKKLILMKCRTRDIVKIKMISIIFSNCKTEFYSKGVVWFSNSPFHRVTNPCSWVGPIPLSSAFTIQSHATDVCRNIHRTCLLCQKFKKQIGLRFWIETQNVHSITIADRSRDFPICFEISGMEVNFFMVSIGTLNNWLS